MKFLLKEELDLTIDSCLVDLILKNDKLLDVAETRAKDVVRNYLQKEYDVDYELRDIVIYDINHDYPDDTRLYLTLNEDHNAFGTSWNIELIDINLLEGEYEVIVKKQNTCTEQYKTEYANNSIRPYSSNSNQMDRTLKKPYGGYNVENEDYDEDCGKIEVIDGILESGHILNYYKSDYVVDEVLPIDYATLTLVESNTYYGNMTYFDQYLLANKTRDFNTDDRNPTLVKIVTDIMIYEVLATVSPTDMSNTHALRYDAAMKELDDIARGRATINLRKHDWTIPQQTGSLRWGLNTNTNKNRY